MSKAIKSGALADALKNELELYSTSVIENVNAAGQASMDKLVKLTKATAPVRFGNFKRSIASKAFETRNGGRRYVWYVKAPDYRLTHLLVKGHATQTGGRVPGDPFLQNALDQVLPEYEKAVEEALK